MKPLVSIVVAVWNVGDFVERCLKSACEQSYEAIEIVVVDDGSTDESGKICDLVAAKDKRVKVYHKKNGGLSSARNYGIKRARGEYVALIDGDDYIRKNYVGDMVKAMKGEIDMVVCGYNDVVPKAAVMSGESAAARLLVEQENLDVVSWNKLYRRDLFEGIDYPDGEKHEDALTTYKLMSAAREVRYITKSLYVYEVREGSIMNQADTLSRLIARAKAAEEAVKYFAHNPELKQAAEVAVLTAKYAFIDAAIRGEIDAKYYAENRRWILKHRLQYASNQYLTRKLKAYNLMLTGFWYKIFRRIRHE